jgi:hypothetical protein
MERELKFGGMELASKRSVVKIPREKEQEKEREKEAELEKKSEYDNKHLLDLIEKLRARIAELEEENEALRKLRESKEKDGGSFNESNEPDDLTEKTKDVQNERSSSVGKGKDDQIERSTLRLSGRSSLRGESRLSPRGIEDDDIEKKKSEEGESERVAPLPRSTPGSKSLKRSKAPELVCFIFFCSIFCFFFFFLMNLYVLMK